MNDNLHERNTNEYNNRCRLYINMSEQRLLNEDSNHYRKFRPLFTSPSASQLPDNWDNEQTYLAQEKADRRRNRAFMYSRNVESRLADDYNNNRQISSNTMFWGAGKGTQGEDRDLFLATRIERRELGKLCTKMFALASKASNLPRLPDSPAPYLTNEVWQDIQTIMQCMKHKYEGTGTPIGQRIPNGLNYAAESVANYTTTPSFFPWARQSFWVRSAYKLLHDIRMSETQPGLIAYFQSAEKRARNIRTPIKVGRYLKQFFPELGDTEIRSFQQQLEFNLQPVTMFFTDACPSHADDPKGETRLIIEKEWVRIYRFGPSSCMRGSDSVRVYVYPSNTLRLAYMTDNSQPDGTPVARCIVRDDEKQWLRIYPDDQGTHWSKMRRHLEVLGYTRGNLNGVRGQLISHSDYNSEIVCPYVDCGDGGEQYIDVHEGHAKEHRYIKFGGEEHDAATTSGYISLNRCRCHECNDALDEDECYRDDGGNPWCASCYDDAFVSAIGRRGYEGHYLRDECIETADGSWYVERYANSNDVYEVDGDWYHVDDLVRDSVTDEYIVAENSVETYDGRPIHADDAVEIEWHDGETYTLHCNDTPEDYLPVAEDDDDEDSGEMSRANIDAEQEGVSA